MTLSIIVRVLLSCVSFMLNVIMLKVTKKPFMLSVIMLNVVMASVIVLNVVMASVIMLNVVAPFKHIVYFYPKFAKLLFKSS
jgi:hypothetical protein